MLHQFHVNFYIRCADSTKSDFTGKTHRNYHVIPPFTSLIEANLSRVPESRWHTVIHMPSYE